MIEFLEFSFGENSPGRIEVFIGELLRLCTELPACFCQMEGVRMLIWFNPSQLHRRLDGNLILLYVVTTQGYFVRPKREQLRQLLQSPRRRETVQY